MNTTSLKKENEFSLQIEEILSCILENVPNNDSRNYQVSKTNDANGDRTTIIEEIKQRIQFLCENMYNKKVNSQKLMKVRGRRREFTSNSG